jgi:hypothetical protein
MQDNNKSILEQIQALLPLEEDDVDTFLELVARTIDLKDPSCIRPLLLLVDDDCPLAGVMDAVLGNLEEFPSQVYVRELLAVLPEVCERSPFWCENEVKKRLWSLTERETLAGELPMAPPETKRCLREMLSRVRLETPQLEDAATFVLARL